MKNIVMRFILLVVLILGGCHIFIGCQQQVDDFEVKSVLPYLSIEGDLDNLNLSKGEMKILFEALGRINVEEKDGLYQLKEKSGAEINISEKLYKFFSAKIEYENQVLISTPLVYLRPRTRTIEEFGGDKEPTDCVAHTIADVLGHYGINDSFNDVSSWIEDGYGENGVPGGSYYEVMDYYFIGEPISIPNYHDDYSFIDDSSVVVVGVIGRPEGGVAHSVEKLKIENNNVIYKDNQNDGQWRYCCITDIRYLYRIDGVRE